ncbi:MAG: hypothetical protein ACEQSR_01840 [Candidatus Methylacidiphilales bacterium]
MKHSLKYCVIILLLNIVNNVSSAQDIYKKKPFLISYGVNIIFEDRNQFENYVKNEPVLWNISPITFGLEKRIRDDFAILGIAGTNVYQEKQKINGITLKESKDVYFIEIGAKLNFVPILKYKTNLDPYVTTTTGYIYRGVTNEINLNIGLGTNYWFNSKFGLNLNTTYRINQTISSENKQGDLLQFSIMIVQIID